MAENIDLLLAARRGVGAFAGRAGTDLVAFTLFAFALVEANFGFIALAFVLGLIRVGGIRIALGKTSALRSVLISTENVPHHCPFRR